MHLTTPEEVASFLAAPRPCPHYWQRTALIFHCEFSTERGPRAAKHVRNKVSAYGGLRGSAAAAHRGGVTVTEQEEKQ